MSAQSHQLRSIYSAVPTRFHLYQGRGRIMEGMKIFFVRVTAIFILCAVVVPFISPDIHAATKAYRGPWSVLKGSAKDGSLTFTGWAANTADSSEVVKVQVARGAAGETIVDTIEANSGPVLAPKTGITGNHRFKWSVPLEYYGTTDTWHLSLIRADGTTQKLANSPRTLTFGAAPAKIQKTPFKIYWGLNTRIEPLADLTAGTQNERDLKRVKSVVQGYMVTSLSGGRLSYWPDRPRRCAVNDKEARGPEEITIAEMINGVRQVTTYNVDQLISECEGLLASSTEVIAKTRASWRNLPLRAAQGRIADDAMSRALDNLNIRGEVAEGKRLESELHMSEAAVGYNATTDVLSFNTASSGSVAYPKTYRFLKEYGVLSEAGLAYQERTKQEETTLSAIPFTKGGTPTGSLPENGRILNMYGNAFEVTGVSSPKLRPNIRVWAKGPQNGVKTMVKSPHFGGINIEGGVGAVDDTTGSGELKVANYAKAIAWLFQNTPADKEASILMPSFINLDELTDEAKYDKNARDRVHRYIKALDRELKANGVKTGVCTDRLIIITGGYGKWIHPEIFPIERGGRTAGTTSGLVFALDEIRTTLCGASQVAGASVEANERDTLSPVDHIVATLDTFEQYLVDVLEKFSWK